MVARADHRIGWMAKKPASKKSKSPTAKAPHHENVVQRVAEEIESRFLEGAEMATETSSAETNVALAALAAIEGPHDAKAEGQAKPAAKRKRPRPKTR